MSYPPIPNSDPSPFAAASTAPAGAIAPLVLPSEPSPPFSPTQAMGGDVELPFGPLMAEEFSLQCDPFVHRSPAPRLSTGTAGSREDSQDFLTGEVPTVVALDQAAPTIRSTATDSNFFSEFSLIDASRDITTETVFDNGALRLNYRWSNTSDLEKLRLEAVQNGSVVEKLGSWSSTKLSDKIINLAKLANIDEGTYKIRAIATTSDGGTHTFSPSRIQVLSWTQKYGTLAPDSLTYKGSEQAGAVFLGQGGTDTLSLSSITTTDVKSINGISLDSFNPLNGSTANQAIFQGSAFDYLTLTNGREIYFQGFENLKFSDGSTVELQVHPDDTYFNEQWNLRVSDVESAWRFTRGSSKILLASLDTGVLTAVGAEGEVVDISGSRLITDPSDDDNYEDYGHGHNAISVMGATANNGSGVTGINWNSSLYVNDVYNGVNLQTAIKDTIAYARANNMKVVFQGGVQGEYWLTDGGTQAELEALISENSDVALFAVAAGNGGPGGNLDDPNYLTSVGGVAKLQTDFSNVMAVGALEKTGTTYVNGLANASTVDIAGYSNRGSNLTLMAATDSPAMDKYGNMSYFSGTSCANPNMAAIASLVWSVNSSLNGGQIRQLLVDTAMDLGVKGRDDSFGHGLVNADAAVRRAWALKTDRKVANLYSSKRW